MKRSAKMTKHIESLRAFLARKGWEEDSYGYMQKTHHAGRQFRMKFSRGALRFEKKVKHGQYSMWIRLQSGPYGKIRIGENDRLSGLTK